MPSITWQQVKHLHKSAHFLSSNGPGGAAIRANGLRDKCVNDYSVGVGSSPLQVDYSPSLPPASLPLSLPLTVLSPLLLHWPMFNRCFPTCRWPAWDCFTAKPAGSGSASHSRAVFVYTVVRTVYCQLDTADSFPNMTSFCCFILSSVQFDIWHKLKCYVFWYNNTSV